MNDIESLNPFENREELQHQIVEVSRIQPCLNPFENREELQHIPIRDSQMSQVLIPLRTGKSYN